MKHELKYKIVIADTPDAEGILKALKANLVEIEDIDNISDKQKRNLEEKGFLRKAVDIDYYLESIKDPTTDIYVAKENDNHILGFASIHKNQMNIHTLRTTLDNLYINNERIKKLITEGNGGFAYLDQISILVEYKRRGIATEILKQILEDIHHPIVAFIVKKPLENKASLLWHEYNGFKLVGTADGQYKNKFFEWYVYIHFNQMKLY
jgi:ribosomal protein S18 acetylase RimI-like enzyme